MVLSLLGGSFIHPAPVKAAIIPPPKVASSIQGTGSLRVNPANPRYFTNDSGKAIYLTGSHTWGNFQNISTSDPPSALDYTAYLDFLQTKHHNFFRLWAWEQSKWIVGTSIPYYFNPLPYQRTGPGNALDGHLKFDVTKFDQAYFDRMRSHIIDAGNRNIYVSIMLFNGWSVDYPKGPQASAKPWRGHPYNASNNINSINGDPNGDESGSEIHTLQIPAITALQKAYVDKVIATVNDLDNVLYEISNESNSNSQAWQYDMINYIKTRETTNYPKQHPVGMTVEYPNGSNTELFNSPADWISPNGDTGNYMGDPTAANGSKVIIVDSDHLWGEGGDRIWVWKSFTRGLNLLYMDCYHASFCTGPISVNDPTRLSVVANMGYILDYAQRMDLGAATPQSGINSTCPTGFCLIANGMEYLIYRPSGSGNITVDLTAATGQLSYEWFNPANGTITGTGTTTGGASRTLSPPSSGEIVLYIYNTGSVATPIITETPLLSTSTRTNTPLVPTITRTNTPLPPTFSPTVTVDDILYLTFTNSGSTGGVSFDDEDILSHNKTSGAKSLYFDGSDVGLSLTDVDGFSLMPDGSILLSIDTAISVGGLGTVADADIIRFIPTSLGSNTAGTFEWYFDGSDVGLTTSGEDIDSIDFAPDGRLIISITDTFSVTGASGGDEDLLAFTATSLGSTTSGTWTMYFDGSDVGLANSANEDINGLWIDPANNRIYLGTVGTFSVTGVSGDGTDIFICMPGSLGTSTTCTYGPGLYLDGSVNGFSGFVMDGFDIVLTSTSNSPTPTRTPTITSVPPTTAYTPTNTAILTPTYTPIVPIATRTLTSTLSANTPTLTPTSAAAFTSTNTPVPPTATHTPATSIITIGETNILGTDDTGYGNMLSVQQVVLSQSATIQSLSFYVGSAGGQLRLGIYGDTGGNPGTLLAQTAAFTPVVGWNTRSVLTPTLLPAGTYWLAYLPQSNSLHFRIAFTGSARGYSYSFGTMPSAFQNLPMVGQFHWSFYATLTR